MKSSMTCIQSNGCTEIDLILKQIWRRFIWRQVSFKHIFLYDTYIQLTRGRVIAAAFWSWYHALIYFYLKQACHNSYFRTKMIPQQINSKKHYFNGNIVTDKNTIRVKNTSVTLKTYYDSLLYRHHADR